MYVPLFACSDPTSYQIQLEHMQRKTFYEIFVLDMLENEGLSIDKIPKQGTFNNIWDKGPRAEFKHVVIRAYKSVDSKDKVWIHCFIFDLCQVRITYLVFAIFGNCTRCAKNSENA